MAKKNFMAYGDAETIFTEYAGALNRKLNCFSGTREDFLALSVAERKKYEYILDPTSDVVVYAVMDEVDDVELTFTNDVATVSIPSITAKSKVWVFYSDASYDVAKAADITVTSGSGVVTFTAANTPTDTITCDILYYLKKDTTNFASVVGGGGHVIEDASGTELPQEDTLQFAGYLRTTDDDTNGKTVVTDAPEEVTWAVWQTMTDEQKTGHHWLITDAPTGADSVRYFTISSSSWVANTGSDATEFPYVYTIASTAYGADFVPAEVLLLGSSSGDYPSSSEEEDIALVDKYIKFTATAIRLRATDAPTNNLTLVIRDGSSSGASSGGGLLPRLMITSTVAPTITKPGGDTAAATHISGNNYYYDAPEWGTYTVTQTIGGTTANVPMNVNTCKIYAVADKTTFEGIQQILNAHMETDLLSVGDEISVTLTGNEPMTWVIGAINHEQQHQVIFVPKWCLATTRQMNSSLTNVGGWNSSAMRTWLNGDFYNNLPDTVKPYIKDRTFQTSQGSQSTALQSATDKIWLPREYEIFGATTYATATEHTGGNAEQFPIFATSANRIKTKGQGGAACYWWESSPHVSNATTFCAVLTSGAADYIAAYDAFGVAPCFHMLANA